MKNMENSIVRNFIVKNGNQSKKKNWTKNINFRTLIVGSSF